MALWGTLNQWWRGGQRGEVDEGCEWKGNKEQNTVGHLYRVIVSPVWPELHPLKTLQPIRHQGPASGYRGRPEKRNMIWVVLNCYFFPGGYMLLPWLKKAWTCMCVYTCFAMGVYEERFCLMIVTDPGVNFLPRNATQHTHTHKANLNTLKLHSLFSFSHSKLFSQTTKSFILCDIKRLRKHLLACVSWEAEEDMKPELSSPAFGKVWSFKLFVWFQENVSQGRQLKNSNNLQPLKIHTYVLLSEDLSGKLITVIQTIKTRF